MRPLWCRRLLWGSFVCVGCVAIQGRLTAVNNGNKRRKLILSANAQKAVTSQYLVRFSDNVSDDDVEELAAQVALQSGGTVRHVFQHAFKGVALVDVADGSNLERILQDNDRISVAEQDERVVLDHLSHDAESEKDGRKRRRLATTQRGNVPRGLDRIDQVSLPLDGVYQHSLDGSGVHVYIIDTGLRATHRDFANNTTECGFDVYDAYYQYVNASIDRKNDQRCIDGLDHGTHVSGIVFGRVSGVAKNVTLIAVAVFDERGRGTRTTVVMGLDYVIGQKLANPDTPMVINMSLSSAYSRFINDVAQLAVDTGIVVVAAAGNENHDACRNSPASLPSVITVGSSSTSRLLGRGQRDRRAFTSNYGRCVDIFAPGDRIVSSNGRNDETFATKSGTSMAAPHVTGAVALYLQRHPTWTPAQVRTALLQDASTGQLMTIFQKRQSPNKLLYTGKI